MRAVLHRAVPVVLLGSFLLLAGCEREPPPELLAEIEALEAERDGLQDELSQVRNLLQEIRREIGEAEVPEDILDRPLQNAADSLRAALRGSAERVAEARNELERTRRQARVLQQRADSLRTAMSRASEEYEAELTRERRRAQDLEGQVADLSSRADDLQARVDRLTSQMESMEADAHRLYWVAGTPEELRRRGIVEQVGGARVLLILWKRGETLVPARDLDPADFQSLDLRETQEIVLPHADRAYRVVSRHNPAFLEADEHGGARFRGGVIRITDSAEILRASRFLVLVEDER
jgi:prefoldin subunit 5